MAITITDSDIYESGSGGYSATHTFPDIDVSGTDTLHVAVGFNRNPASDVTGWTSETNAMTTVIDSINVGVCACSVWRYLINNAATTTVSSTPSYKLQAGVTLGLSGVDQTTPIAGTPSEAGGYGASATAAYTGTAGNLLLVFVSTQNDKTFTASNCTAVNSVTHADANLGSGFVGQVEANGSSQTIGATWTGNDNYRMAIVEITAAGSAAITFVAYGTWL